MEATHASSTSTPSSPPNLPIELLEPIFTLAARISHSTAGRLSRVSHWARTLVLPELYSVLVVEGARWSSNTAAQSIRRTEQSQWAWRLKSSRALRPSEQHDPSDDASQAIRVAPWKQNTLLVPLDAHHLVHSLFITTYPKVFDEHHISSVVGDPSMSAYDEITPLLFGRLDNVRRLCLTSVALSYLHGRRDGFDIRAGEALFPELSEIQLFGMHPSRPIQTEDGLPQLKSCGVRLDRLTHVSLPGTITLSVYSTPKTIAALSRAFSILPRLTHFSYNFSPMYVLTGSNPQGRSIDASLLVEVLRCVPSTVRYFVLRMNSNAGSQEDLDELVQKTNNRRLLIMPVNPRSGEETWISWRNLAVADRSLWDEALRLRRDHVRGLTYESP